jgi:hypothetical protein
LILGDVSNLQSAIDLDTVLQETGLYSLFITSRETEKTGRYTINKKLAAPAAYILNDAADFCARLNFVKKHADVYFNFVTKEITRVEKNMFTQTFYATDAELVKGKTATIEKGFRTLYSSTIYTGGKKEVEKKFAEYEKMIRSCLVNDWDFKSSDDPADKNGNIHTLTASTGYVRSLVMNIVLDKSGNYSLVVEIK